MDYNALLVVALLVLGLLLVGAVVATVTLAVKLWRLRALLHGAGVPTGAKVGFWLALLYAASPVDLVPDPVYLDDVLVLLLAYGTVRALLRRVERPVVVQGHPVDVQDVPRWRGHDVVTALQDRPRR
ncbi:MAG TPA: DUF1232 domain-containing protein [Dermatophilaceae bacterium]|nr:DUF1232 domain-containing protein [Dermatophilaceae bacterium]